MSFKWCSWALYDGIQRKSIERLVFYLMPKNRCVRTKYFENSSFRKESYTVMQTHWTFYYLNALRPYSFYHTWSKSDDLTLCMKNQLKRLKIGSVGAYFRFLLITLEGAYFVRFLLFFLMSHLVCLLPRCIHVEILKSIHKMPHKTRFELNKTLSWVLPVFWLINTVFNNDYR